MRRPTLPSYRQRFAHQRNAYRSGLEEAAAKQIATAGLRVYFETLKVPFIEPAKSRKYTPDFILPNGIVIETKGLFQTQDRQKHKLIKAAYPDLDLRFVFSRAASRIAPKSPTTYSAWCDALGIPWANKTIPPEWLSEAANLKSLAQLATLGWIANDSDD